LTAKVQSIVDCCGMLAKTKWQCERGVSRVLLEDWC
jgi:hypothetical protein